MTKQGAGCQIARVIDAHCHLADEVFASDLAAVVARAQAAGVTRALCVVAAGEADELARAAAVARAWPSVCFSAGVHPHAAARYAGNLDEVAAAVRAAVAALPGMCAIGEIGLDYHYDLAPRDVQRQVFARQIALARELGAPIVIHTREADADTVAMLRSEGARCVSGMFHCFTGTEALAREALALGFHISFSGIVTFPRAAPLRDVAKRVPDDRLLAETDSPYLAPVPHRGTRNEPARIGSVYATLAEARGAPAGRLAAVIAANFERLFGRTDRERRSSVR